MATLVVRNVNASVVKALKKRADQNGRSAAAEHREILQQTLLGKPKKSFVDFLRSMPNVGRDEDFQRQQD